MPTYEQGNMWSVYDEADLFCITTNSFIRNDGCLVMGAGIAKQAKERIPGLAKSAGKKVEEVSGHLGIYGLLPPDNPDSNLALFQVKTHWEDKAKLQLIAHSALNLTQWLGDQPKDAEAHVNFPGIGNGGLDKTDVIPMIDPWPDNVHVWTYS